MNDKVKIITDNFGEKYLVFDSDYLNEAINYINRNNIKIIDINSYWGYKLKDIEFLKYCPNIESISITDNDIDIEGLKYLKNLKTIGGCSVPLKPLDLLQFKQLETIRIDYHKNWVNIDKCFTISELHLQKMKQPDLIWLNGLKNLENLSLSQGTIQSLKGLEYFPKLKKFEGHLLSKLTSLGIEKDIPSLEEFIISTSKKVYDLEALKVLSNLRNLSCSECGSIKSIGFVNEMPAMKRLIVWVTNIEDGDTMVFRKMEKFAFDNRKHYNLSYNDLQRERLGL